MKKGNPFLALGAAVIGVASILVAIFASVGAGLAMMLLPFWMIYKAS
ncbi:hypothetical protein ACFL2V_09975 [Pseudomonadota bacterium]